uniref:AlNc14C8G1014 protein n=1 Tax=Albugo laibachii Nc14 TaxID=890382 RepID=F0W1T4_9STRA|nr:AlNc14C8G1014 [Albugo laibachii Nc14]|eukprot:CCA15013.1 AlNc14C8G1014 [Albugo laibachii Nc14]
MTTKPTSPTTDPIKALLKYAETKLSGGSIPPPEELEGDNDASSHMELFDYDFSCERIILELAQAEMETRRKEEDSTAGRVSLESQANAANRNDRIIQAADGTSHQEASSTTFRRQLTADDIAIAISASLQDY